MRILHPRLLTAAILFAALLVPSSALRAQGGDLAEIIRVTPLPGHASAFEAGVREYFEDVRRQGAPVTWFTWEIMTGENTGSYYVGTFGHSWADFDEMMPSDPAAMRASFEENIEPHVGSAVAGFWTRRGDLSYASMEEQQTPAPFEALYWIKPTMAGAQEWEGLVQEVAEAAGNADWAMHWEVYQLVNGGELPQYVLSMGAESFAGFEEPSPNMGEMLMQQLGEARAEEMFRRFGELTDWEKSEMIAWREDLSYLP